MLSDGVFAIALTLLALDVRAPGAWDGRLASLLGALAPQLDAYALSAVVIGVYWLAHRRFLALVHEVDAPATVLTLVMLSLVALLPAATRLAHAFPDRPMAMVVYGALVILIGLSLAGLWAHAALIARIVHPALSGPLRWRILWLILLTPPLFLAVVTALPVRAPGMTPLALALLFLIGWRLRLWGLRRLNAPTRKYL